MTSYSDLIKLTAFEGRRRCLVDPKIIVGLEEMAEIVKEGVVSVGKRTRIDIINGDKVTIGAYLVTESAEYINMQMENGIARNQNKQKEAVKKT